MSPVGWSTFATGVDPSGHNIFDFLARDKVTHLPVLSSTRLVPKEPRKLGPLTLPGGGAKFESLKRSKPFWKTCAEAGVASTILRVPITFPPDRYGGRLLSAMCVPDLRGTQGTFSHYTEPGVRDDDGRTVGGVRLELESTGAHIGVTVSGGVTCNAVGTDDKLESMVQAADKALRRARKAGGNRVDPQETS